ncbi:hypothetical protein ACR3K2_09510 [Cryptosporidium serpentis]
MILEIVIFAICSIFCMAIGLALYIQYNEKISIESTRHFLKDSVLYLCLFQISFYMLGIIKFKILISTLFIDWWAFYDGSVRYPFIFGPHSFYPAKMVLLSLIKAVITVRYASKFSYPPLILPYVIVCVCLLPLLFAFSYPYEDSNLMPTTWDSEDIDILLNFIRIISSPTQRKEYILYTINKIRIYSSTLYRRCEGLRIIISMLPKYIRSHIVSILSIEDI